jgi:hypothetical protein
MAQHEPVADPGGHQGEIAYFVDGEREDTRARQLAAETILTQAGFGAGFVLVRDRDGREFDPKDLVELHDGERFTAKSRTRPDRQDIEVSVFAPRSPDPKAFEWSKHLLVSAAAQEAATAFGYTGGTPGLTKDEVALDPADQLAAAGVRNGDTLELLDKGGGV